MEIAHGMPSYSDFVLCVLCVPEPSRGLDHSPCFLLFRLPSMQRPGVLEARHPGTPSLQRALPRLVALLSLKLKPTLKPELYSHSGI